MSVISGCNHCDYIEELRDAFKVFDHESRGYINALGLRRVMNALGEKMTDYEINKMILQADLDGDGKLSCM